MLLAIVLIVMLYIYTLQTTYTTANAGNNTYKVLNFSDADGAARILDSVNNKNLALIAYMSQYSDQHGQLLAQRMRQRYQPTRLQENAPSDSSNTSYTEDKGAKLALCLREKKSGNNHLHDTNLVDFVDLHEMSHIASQGYGHEEEFWRNFTIILRDAQAAGIYTPVDYSKSPVNYCGLDVTYNPYYK